MRLQEFIASLDGRAKELLMSLRETVTDKEMEEECAAAMKAFVLHAKEIEDTVTKEPNNAEAIDMMLRINGVMEGEYFTLGFVVVTSDGRERRIPTMIEAGATQDSCMSLLGKILDEYKGDNPMLKAVVQIATSVCLVGRGGEDMAKKNAEARAKLSKGEDADEQLSCSVVMVDGRMGTLIVEENDSGDPTGMRWMSEASGMKCTQLSPADDLVMRYLAARLAMSSDVSTDGWTEDGWETPSRNTKTDTEN